MTQFQLTLCFSLAELTTVILISAFPVMPKFIQYCRGHASIRTSAPSSGKSTAPPKLSPTDPPCRKFSSHWSRYDEPVPSLELSYARSEEPVSLYGERVNKGIQRLPRFSDEKASSKVLSYNTVEAPPINGIRKTIRIETTNNPITISTPPPVKTAGVSNV